MESAPKHKVLDWLNENFESVFLVIGLISIILFITWQVIYRYVITQFIERAGRGRVDGRTLPLYLHLDLLPRGERGHPQALVHPRGHPV